MKIPAQPGQLLDTLLPRLCLLCRCPAPHNLCSECAQHLPFMTHACRTCGAFLPDSSVGMCGKCQRKARPVSRLVAAYRYQEPVSSLVSRFKFQHDFAAGEALAASLMDAVRFAYGDEAWPDLVLPVPLHASRLRERGFNQSVFLGEYLSHRLNIRLEKNALQRTRATRDQIGLKAMARRHNVRRAFTMQPISAHHVAILDDVVTTGATVLEIAKLLKSNGVSQVDVWCIAKTGNS